MGFIGQSPGEIVMRKLKLNPTTIVMLLFVLCMVAFPAAAQDQNFGAVAENVSGQLGAFGKLALGAMFLAGIGVAAGAAFKFKAHSENAQQVPIKVPLFWTLVAAILIAIPTFLSVGKTSLFGTDAGGAQVEENPLDNF
jgi:hypothetical protein